MRIFVAGASGAIGRVLVPMLVDAGHEVVGTSRSASAAAELASLGAKGVVLDVLDPGATTEAVRSAAPDVVLHELTALAGGSSADNAHLRRVGTRNLVEATKATGVSRMVAQSISWAYAAGDTPADESDALDVGAPEPRSMTIGGIQALEGAVAELPEHVILRYGTLYGPGTWYVPNGFMAGKLAGGELAANDAVSSFIHVRDAARTTVQALEWPNGPVNIVDDEPAPARAWVPVLAGAVGRPTPEPTSGRAGWERGATNGLAKSRGMTLEFPSWRTGFAGGS